MARGLEMTHPEETRKIAPVPVTGIQHVRRENAADYTHDIATKEKRSAGTDHKNRYGYRFRSEEREMSNILKIPPQHDRLDL